MIRREPLSLPENRTEDDNRALTQWLDATTHTESRMIGTQSDESGKEREIWQHTFTPATTICIRGVDQYGIEQTELLSVPVGIAATWVSKHRYRTLHGYLDYLRSTKDRKRTRRQRRAAQRRHNRGLR